jgi:hypothetical protein
MSVTTCKHETAETMGQYLFNRKKFDVLKFNMQIIRFGGDYKPTVNRKTLGYRSGSLGSIPGTTRKIVVGQERSPLIHMSTTEELLDRKVAAPV